MIGKPKLENRTEQHYVGIHLITPLRDFPTVIPQTIDEVFGWMNQQGIDPAGAPLMRLNIVNMENKMVVEIGVPVAKPVAGDGRIKPGVLPAGRYASLIYTGVQNGLEGNKALIEWAQENGIELDRWDVPEGDAFRSRVEFFLDGPEDDPDSAKWDTEVAILTKDS